jgi:hypothetical protein
MKRRQGRKGRSPRDYYRGFIGGPWLTPAAGERKGVAAVWLTGGAGAEGARGSGEARPAGRGCAGCAAALV